MKPLTNSQIAAQARETGRKFGTQSTGTGLGSFAFAYTFGRLQVVWSGQGAEVRDTNGSVVMTGTRGECIEWAKARA